MRTAHFFISHISLACGGILFFGNAVDFLATREKVVVLMQSNIFEPKEIHIKKGTEVIFKNNDMQQRWPASNLHPTHGIYPEFDPQEPVSLGGQLVFVFNKKGKWPYHDHLTPSIRGVVIVE